MRNCADKVFTALDITSTQTSIAINAAQLFAASVQGVFTGSTPTGTLKLQACNDNLLNLNPQVPVNWTDITGASVAVSATGAFLIPKLDICYQWVRVVWTFTSGTGTVSATINTNGF